MSPQLTRAYPAGFRHCGAQQSGHEICNRKFEPGFLLALSTYACLLYPKQFGS